MPEKELRRESSLSLSESDSSDTKSADLAESRRNSVSEPQPPQEPAWPMDLSNKSTGVYNSIVNLILFVNEPLRRSLVNIVPESCVTVGGFDVLKL
jgi:hypothetical protein